MKLVRDRTKSKSEVGGRTGWAIDSACPCRSCYRMRNFGYRGSPKRYCVKLRYFGCPDPMPEPEHILRTKPCSICIRCGKHLTGDERAEATIATQKGG